MQWHMAWVEQSRAGTLFLHVALSVSKSCGVYCLIKALLNENYAMPSEGSDMLFPNSTCLPVSLQAEGGTDT